MAAWLGGECSVFSIQYSVFSIQCSVFSVQCSDGWGNGDWVDGARLRGIPSGLRERCAKRIGVLDRRRFEYCRAVNQSGVKPPHSKSAYVATITSLIRLSFGTGWMERGGNQVKVFFK
jgi:hypothetical protein